MGIDVVYYWILAIRISPSVPNLKFAVSPIHQGMRDSLGLWPGDRDGASATGSLGVERERTCGAEIAGGSAQHGAGVGAAGADRAGLRRGRAEQGCGGTAPDRSGDGRQVAPALCRASPRRSAG